MAVYRKVSISFWTDTKVDENFSPEDKYFYLYLLTNPHTNLCGCYEISYKAMKNETGYSRDSLSALINRFEKTYNLIRYDNDTSEMLILNWRKYNWSASPKFEVSLQKEISQVKNTEFKDFLLSDGYSIDTVSIQSNTVSILSNTVTISNTVNDNSSLSNEEVSNDSNLNKVTVQKKGSKRRVYEDTPDFIEFWNAYPNKKNKMEARTAFAKVDVPLQVLLDSIETQKHSKQWIKDDGEYIPLASTWLNKRRWEDVMEVKVEKNDGMDRYRNLQRLAEEFDDE